MREMIMDIKFIYTGIKLSEIDSENEIVLRSLFNKAQHDYLNVQFKQLIDNYIIIMVN